MTIEKERERISTTLDFMQAFGAYHRLIAKLIDDHKRQHERNEKRIVFHKPGGTTKTYEDANKVVYNFPTPSKYISFATDRINISTDLF